MEFNLKRGVLLAGPLNALAIGISCWWYGLATPACWCAATASLCAMWWIFECLPIVATALLPFVVFPFVGVLSHKEVAASYGHTMILLLLGGFLLSAAMEKSGAHRRLAVQMVRAVGGRGERRVVLGFMLATALLSMWISNTATTLMMLPIALAVLERQGDDRLRVALLLGIAYAASVGGMGTPVGTPPNAMFMGFYEEKFGKSLDFTFWMSVALPIVCIVIPLIWWWVTRGLSSDTVFDMPRVDAWTTAESRVMVVFAIAAMLWITRTTPFGGWSQFIGSVIDDDGMRKVLVGDATVALGAALALFIIPRGSVEGDALLDWETAEKVPWGILLLFGGGLALAKGFDVSGLSAVIGESLAGLADLPPLLVIGGICLMVTFLTEITSGTATTALLLPILASTAGAAGVKPEMIMIPGTISASCAFMLPVATAPNTIVYGAGAFSTAQMARKGLFLNFAAASVITIICWLMLAE